MDRRSFLSTMGVGLLTAPDAAWAQTAGKVARVGFLAMSAPSASPYYDAFRYGMRDHGWVEGKNLVVEYRSADGKPESFPGLASDLVRSRVDVILALVPGAVFAAKSATQTIPIVMVAIPDPVAMGLVASLARPGGNMTGLTTLSADMSVKQLELLKQLAPRATTLAVLSNPTNPWHPHALRLLQANAPTLGIRLSVLSVRTPEQCAEAISEVASRHSAGGVLVLADPMTVVYCAELSDLALKHRLPAVVSVKECAVAGGLASYWPNSEQMIRRSAWYVDAILKGASPANLPIEQPAKLELVINLKTAKALGLTIPPSLLLRADQVIQ